jgi:hypothetical protein
MYLAHNLPKNIVKLLGKNSAGIAKIKIQISPAYKKTLKIKDFKNRIKN